MSSRTNRGGARQYPRTARLNELLREILAEELEKLDDERLEMVTITAVDIEGDLRHAAVFYDSLQGEEGDAEILEAFSDVRWRLQGAIGRQARIKRTPELSFAPDAAVRSGARIEELLAELPPVAADAPAVDAGTPDADASDPGPADLVAAPNEGDGAPSA
jgi:ribosome-binding factor A